MTFGLLAVLDWNTISWWISTILKVAAALGTVVFVHELGHFLVAKACGVMCPKFYVGFDMPIGLLINKALGRPGEFTIFGLRIPRTIGPRVKWGETEYGIGIVPLGGYVKMFGQDDDPATIAQQMQQSQIDANSTNAVAITGPNGETYYVDRRSYLAKSVPQRMAIISAGVTMNIIFAFIFATIAYGMGVKYLPCVVSETTPGSPAWQLGLEPGDEIVQLGERKDPTFMQLKGGVTLGDLELGVPVEVRRAATDKIESMTLRPRQEAGELATVGLISPQTLTLHDDDPVAAGSAAEQARLVGPETSSASDKAAGLRAGDTVVSVNGVEVKSYREYAAEIAESPDKPITIVVRRSLETKDGEAKVASAIDVAKTELLTFEIPAQPMYDFGLVMKMRPITALQAGSPAEKAGMKVGDLITQVDGKGVDETGKEPQGWTPATLPAYLQQAALAGREVEFGVERDSAGKKESLSFRMKPVVSTTAYMGVLPASDTVGIAYGVENKVLAVVPDSAASSAKITAGDDILEAKIIPPADTKGKKLVAVTLELGAEHNDWPMIVDAMQLALPGTKVELRYQHAGDKDPQKVVVEPRAVAGAYIVQRGLIFEPEYRVRTAANFGQAIQYGWDETTDALTMVFRFLQKLGRQVPIKMLGGPGTIAVAAGDAASQGFSSLLVFLTMLSANLAVINFLPIPILDGGHMMFLLYEGLRGRPANERIVMAMHMAGFVFILSLMIFVIGLDIHRWILT